jgi:squalene-hopene/tetraprenyl-beta-curcumene cyclase
LEALAATGGPRDALAKGANWLIEATKRGTVFPPAPIGFYFAKLWYYEEAYSVLWTVGALNAVRGQG